VGRILTTASSFLPTHPPPTLFDHPFLLAATRGGCPWVGVVVGRMMLWPPSLSPLLLFCHSLISGFRHQKQLLLFFIIISAKLRVLYVFFVDVVNVGVVVDVDVLSPTPTPPPSFSLLLAPCGCVRVRRGKQHTVIHAQRHTHRDIKD
jgi:hypothetical protein